MPDEVRHPLFARLWTFAMARLQPREVVERRRAMLRGLEGRVVEVGAGTGANFGLYPETVREVVAVEPEPYLRERAAEAASALARPAVAVRAGSADALPLPDGSCDAAVACLVLCSVPDQAAALAELRRVLRPGGELRFLEHVAAGPARPVQDRVQRALDGTVWPRAFGGCHVHRETLAAIEASGFRPTGVERFDLGRLSPAGRHAAGVAIRD